MNVLSRLFAFVRCLALLGVLVGAASPALAANTAPTFTVSDGILNVSFGASREWGKDVEIQSDGKILLTLAGSNGGSSALALLSRFNADGTIDNTFGVSGNVLINDSFGYETTIQSDGKIIHVGSNSMYRYNEDGSADNTFGSSGKLVLSGLQTVAIQSDGRVIVGAYRYNGVNSDFAVFRYNSDGSVDVGFGSNGVTVAGFGTLNANLQRIAIQTDGKVVAVGSVTDAASGNASFAVVRFNLDGSLDSSFGNDGKITTSLSAYWSAASGVTTQPDGKILVAGTTSSLPNGYGDGQVFALVRYNPDGSLDSTFDGDGKVTTATNVYGSGGSDVVVQSDGKILVAGWGYNGSNANAFTLVRYSPNGGLDTSFGVNGIVHTSIGNIGSFASKLTLQNDGKIVVTGYVYGGQGQQSESATLLRYNTDGSLDATFSPAENTLGTSPVYIENGGPIVLDSHVQVLDADLATIGNYNGATLVLSRHASASSQDVFSAASNALTTLTTGSYFAVDSVTIGRVITNSAGTLTLAFNANATQSLVNKAMQQIAYANTSDAPPATVQIDWTFNDGNTGAQGTGGSMSVTGSTTVTITATNDSPVLSVALIDQIVAVAKPFSYTVPEGSFTDLDLESLSYSVIMADGTGVPPWLSFNPTTKTFSGTASNFDTGAFDIRVTAKDAANATATDIFRLTVIASNSLPTGTVTFSGTTTLGQTLTAANTLADIDGIPSTGTGAISYQWKADGVDIAGATSATLVLGQAQVGKVITVVAQYTDAQGNVESEESVASSPIGSAMQLLQGWNLLGNGQDQPLPIATLFGNPLNVTTVWKWNAASLGWQFYAPSMDTVALQNYANSKGYGVLTTINPGEGFWVNAVQPFSVAQPSGTAVVGNDFSAGKTYALKLGWNLVAVGADSTPSAFNIGLSATPPAVGTVPINLTTLWAWDNAQSKWYFYAPNLEGQGGTSLFDYTASKGYLDFAASGKALGPGVGFWVNKP